MQKSLLIKLKTTDLASPSGHSTFEKCSIDFENSFWLTSVGLPDMILFVSIISKSSQEQRFFWRIVILSFICQSMLNCTVQSGWQVTWEHRQWLPPLPHPSNCSWQIFANGCTALWCPEGIQWTFHLQTCRTLCSHTVHLPIDWRVLFRGSVLYCSQAHCCLRPYLNPGGTWHRTWPGRNQTVKLRFWGKFDCATELIY